MNQNGGIHKGGFAVLCHRNGGSESPGILNEATVEKRDTGFAVRESRDTREIWLYFLIIHLD